MNWKDVLLLFFLSVWALAHAFFFSVDTAFYFLCFLFRIVRRCVTIYQLQIIPCHCWVRFSSTKLVTCSGASAVAAQMSSTTYRGQVFYSLFSDNLSSCVMAKFANKYRVMSPFYGVGVGAWLTRRVDAIMNSTFCRWRLYLVKPPLFYSGLSSSVSANFIWTVSYYWNLFALWALAVSVGGGRNEAGCL